MRNVLVVVQISLCVVLLCTTGLFLRSLDKSAEEDPGFRTSGLLMLSIDPVHNGYTARSRHRCADTRLRERVTAMPRRCRRPVRIWFRFRCYRRGASFILPRIVGECRARSDMQMFTMWTAGYFDTMGIPRVAGRDFNAAEPNAPKQTVVNEAFAQLIVQGAKSGGWDPIPTCRRDVAQQIPRL